MPPIVSPAAADCRFADVAAAYLERHIRRYLVPRPYRLALGVQAFLATIHVPGPAGALILFPDKPFRLITTDDVEHAIEQKARPVVFHASADLLGPADDVCSGV